MKTPVALALASLVLAGCATIPPPTQLLDTTDEAIRRAEASRVTDQTLPELREARAKQAAARTADQQGNRLLATRLTEQAQLDAELATLKTEISKLQFTIEATKKGNEALRQQALRSAVVEAPTPIPAPIDPTLPVEP